MKSVKIVSQVREAIANLSPNEVRELAERPFQIELFAAGNQGYWKMEEFFAPPDTSVSRREQMKTAIVRAGEASMPQVIRVYEKGMAPLKGAFVFDPAKPKQVICDILDAHDDLQLALARRVAPFRSEVTKRIIREVAQENALFSIATAVPFIVPFISLPWAFGEFASDTAFLTLNQMRMAFKLAAASDREIGYKQQRAEIGSLIAGAFGWRTLARELIGAIPMGGGIIPKAAIAFAGTYVVGMSLERYYRLGYHMTRQERKQAYEAAFQRGKEIVGSLLQQYKARQA